MDLKTIVLVQEGEEEKKVVCVNLPPEGGSFA